MTDREGLWWAKSWNPTRGCKAVSPGCANCYAQKAAGRMGGPGGAYEGLVCVHPGRGWRWTGEGRLVGSKLVEPLSWRKPQRVFVDSMSDLFFEEFNNMQIAAVWCVMAASPTQTFLVSTKRTERELEWFAWLEQRTDEVLLRKPGASRDWARAHFLVLAGCLADVWEGHQDRAAPADLYAMLGRREYRLPQEWPLPNVYLIASAEDQAHLDKRLPALLKCPAAMRGLSLEPLLGPIVFPRTALGQGSDCPECGFMVAVDADGCCQHCGRDAMWYGVDFVLAGGETGGQARPCDLCWLEEIVHPCTEHDVPVFIKQLGRRAFVVRVDDGKPYDDPCNYRDHRGADVRDWPPYLRRRQLPPLVTPTAHDDPKAKEPSMSNSTNGAPEPARKVRIWSFQHDAWWRPHSCGYTKNRAEAGLYDRARAEAIVKSANIACEPDSPDEETRELDPGERP